MTPLILLFPLIVAMLAILVGGDHKNAKHIALGGSVLSLLLFPLIGSGTSNIGWFTINGVQLTISTSITPLNSLLLFIVLLIAPLIFAYSWGFMELPSEQKRYYVEMLAFETAMVAFAMAGNFILLFIAWEFLSLTSYLLIGFWYNRERALAAARKTITIILIGDIALLGSMVIFQNAFGSLQFSDIISTAGTANLPIAAMILLVVAVMTKSAQFPFHEWLPAAMEGPTPVSAFLHSSTMVKAGVFATIVLFPIFAASKELSVLVLIGAITVVLSVFNAMREKHIKKVLAYSTVQELGIMFIAIGSGALLAAIYFFFAQSFYKALLFFSSGVTMKANDKEDLDEISGLDQNRLVYFSTLFGVLALAGFVPFDGFFANAGLGSAFSTNLLVYVFMMLVSLGTSFYIFRWLTLQQKQTKVRILLNYRGTPTIMTYSMVVLAALTLIASAFFFQLPSFFSGIGFVSSGSFLNISAIDALAETVIVAIGAYAGYTVYRQIGKRKIDANGNKMVSKAAGVVYTAWLMDASYRHIAAFADVLAEGVAYLDERLNSVFDLSGHYAMVFGERARKMAFGNINAYVAAFAAGLLLLIIIIRLI